VHLDTHAQCSACLLLLWFALFSQNGVVYGARESQECIIRTIWLSRVRGDWGRLVCWDVDSMAHPTMQVDMPNQEEVPHAR
jgi:hypothetical protein